MVKATTITINSLLARPKLDCDVGYDTAVKGASVVVMATPVPTPTLAPNPFVMATTAPPRHDVMDVLMATVGVNSLIKIFL